MDHGIIIGWIVVILKVLVGLGFVIFVHELGHFVVAKLCGVKCEKFYLGFDIAGLKFCRFRWGETEYGIGILPLGGYVKMLGQEDNPAKLREEMERAKQKGEGAKEKGEERGQGTSVPSNVSSIDGSIDVNPETAALFDPRSYLAKSVPKRMAIISAGVIMNVIFAFLMAVVAFWMGVPQVPCTVGGVLPGDPAWQADLRSGDEILKIGNRNMSEFNDLKKAISLGENDSDQGVPILVRRSGVEKPFEVLVKPDRSYGFFFIGVTGPMTTTLTEDKTTWLVPKRFCTRPGSPADLVKEKFHTGDKIVKIDDMVISTFGQINKELIQKTSQNLTVVIDRAAEPNPDGTPSGYKRRIAIPVKPNPMRHLGLTLKMGKISAVQNGSPAANASIKPGDKLVSPTADDPMKLPQMLNNLAGQELELKILSENAKEPRTVKVTLRQPMDYELSDNQVGISSLGIAFEVSNEVEKVLKGSPADKAGIQPGDILVKAKINASSNEEMKKLEYPQVVNSIEFNDENRKGRNWPALVLLLQRTLPGATVDLTLKRANSEKEKEINAKNLDYVVDDQWFNPDRGFLFEPLEIDRKIQSLGDAISIGYRETLDSLTLVYRTLSALGTARVSPKMIGGPWMIANVAAAKADEGNAVFLLFLTMLSANLAVLNFLPIPVLDGGHFVLLAYEGIRGKPANEHVQTVLAYIGLVLILALMVWACSLDFHLIKRW